MKKNKLNLESPAWWSPSAVLQTPNFCGNMWNFRYRGNRGRLGSSWMMPLYCPTPKTASLAQESGTYRLYKPSYSQLYVQIVNFSLQWQQGSVGRQFEWYHETGRRGKPPLWYKNLGHLLYRPSYSHLCVQMPIFMLEENFTNSNSPLL